MLSDESGHPASLVRMKTDCGGPDDWPASRPYTVIEFDSEDTNLLDPVARREYFFLRTFYVHLQQINRLAATFAHPCIHRHGRDARVAILHNLKCPFTAGIGTSEGNLAVVVP